MFCANLGAVISVGGGGGGTYWIAQADTNNNIGYYLGSSAIDSSGNVYTTGALTSGSGGYLRKVNSSGVLQWGRDINTYPFYRIAVSSAGDVYLMAGDNVQGLLVMKFSTTGAITWQKNYSTLLIAVAYPGGLALDSAGVPHVFTGDGNTICYVLKLTTAGAMTWQRAITVSAAAPYPKTVTVDSSGNVIGMFQDTGVGDTVFVKYNSAGTSQWMKSITGGSPANNEGASAVDTAGNVYFGHYNGSNWALLKLSSTGVFQWQTRITTVLGWATQPYGMVVDSTTGDVYVVGNYDTSAANTNGLILKFNSAGTMQYQRRLTLTGATRVVCSSVVFDTTSTLVIGYSGNTTPGVDGAIRIPSDGTKTGTYGSYTYAVLTGALTFAVETPTVSTYTATLSTPTGTLSNATQTASASAVTNTLISIP